MSKGDYDFSKGVLCKKDMPKFNWNNELSKKKFVANTKNK